MCVPTWCYNWKLKLKIGWFLGTAPLSPISLMKTVEGRENEVSEMTRRLLSKLIKLIQKTDQPLYVLFLKVDVGLAAKVFSLLFGVFVARLKGLFLK